MSEPYIGEIRMFGGNFAPRNYALCNGQLMSIAQNTALFAILGTTYGGDGQVTFALPDLRGRVPINPGQGPGLSNYVLGEVAGTESVTLLNMNLAQHTHLVACNNGNAGLPSPGNNFMAQALDSVAGPEPTYLATANNTLNQAAIKGAGGSLPIGVVQPILCVNFIIALYGAFPSRN